MADAKILISHLLESLNNLYALSFKRVKTIQDVQKAVYNLGQLINFYKRELGKVVENKAASLESLIKFANYLDAEGLYDLANIVDESIFIVKKAEDYGFFPKNGKSSVKEEDPIIKPLNESSLSTRYCPDHNGVQSFRISQNIYQCPIDGKKYNYEMGYINYEGQNVPGGSVAAQTPTTSDFGGIPMRIYDSRSDVLNRIN